MNADEKLNCVFENIARPGNRSALFWWMFENHDIFMEAAARHRMRWKRFCADVSELGITDTLGKPATERNARETWFQVRKEKAKLIAANRKREEAEHSCKEAAAEARRLQPSRQPGSWLPDVATPRPVESRLPAVCPPASSNVEKEPWDDPSLTPAERERVKSQWGRIDRKREWDERHRRRLVKKMGRIGT